MSEIKRYLFVDTDKYKVHINPYLTFEDSTALESMFIPRNIYDLDDKWSLYYIQQRVIPYNRQGIGGV